ncbi:MAG: DsrE family protein [Magnetococcales bacterium]|nr:DsrE family protein [Magnetococcales bacterium]
MRLSRFFALILFCLTANTVTAGPADPSRFDGSRSPAQKAVYHFNFATPDDAMKGLKRVKNHLKALKAFGDPKNSHIVVVLNGNELHAFSRLNQEVFSEIYPQLKSLSEQGVDVRVCRNAGRARGYEPDQFYDLVTVVPAAVSELARLQNQGYAYLHIELNPRMTRKDLIAEYAELGM